MERRTLGAGHLVPRQGHAPHAGRLGRRRDRRHDAGAGAVARRLRRGQGVQDRLRAAAVRPRRRRRQDRGGRIADGGRPHQQERRHQRPPGRIWSSSTTNPSPMSRAARPQKMVEEDNIDVHVGGFLSNICLACMPVWQEAKILNMISVCLDTTLTTSNCNRYTFRAARLRAGASGRLRAHAHQDGQEVAHRLCRLFLGPVDARRLRRGDQEERRRSGRHHRHPARHRRHDAVPVEDYRQFRRAVRHLLRQGRRDHRQPGLRSRPHQEVQVCRRRLDLRADQSAGTRQQDRRLHRHQSLHPDLRRAARHALSQGVVRRSQDAAGQDRSVRPAARQIRAVELRGLERR